MKFSRFVNLTYPEPWQKDFQYHGCNVYAYILGKWNDAIDLIFVQFYESCEYPNRVSINNMIESCSYLFLLTLHFCRTISWMIFADSHAAYRVSVVDMNPSEFLIAFNHRLVAQGEGLSVRFESDPSVALNNQFVSLPLSKLVFGFANGWALNDGNGDGKVVFFERDAVNQAYESLKNDKMEPRGFGFWVVEEVNNKNTPQDSSSPCFGNFVVSVIFLKGTDAFFICSFVYSFRKGRMESIMPMTWVKFWGCRKGMSFSNRVK